MLISKIHLMGIGGVGMAGLAVLLKARGAKVSGCDIHVSPRTRWLEAQGISVAQGHDPAHVADADLLIVTPAVSVDAPERLRAPHVRFRGEVLAELAGSYDTIAVCGSHGKTTTATWVAKLLLALGVDVGWCIGGETGDFPVAHVGTGPLVIEADESDGTLALYAARTLVVNKCEYDHPDHFKTPAEYFACFDAARAKAADVIESESLAPLDFVEAIPALAPHNRKNARAAVEVALRRGFSPEAIAAVLPQVVATLPDRRFQRIAAGVYADYAHHPTEMRCAVEMARAVCPGRLLVLFQPHRYSRTRALLGDFPAAFAGADEVVLCPTYAAFERPVEGGGVADLYAACRAAGLPVRLARSCDEAWEHAANVRRGDDVVLLLGAGDIIDLKPRVVEDCSEHPPERPMRRVLIGQGTNTWRSDLCLNVEYVRTTGPADAPGASLGIPWMAGVPGTVGGWIRMNAGAFGHSISELVLRVKVDGVWQTAEACGFGYRTSAIRGEIQDFILKPFDPDEKATADFLSRRPRFPAGTKGSVFKNPPGDFAGRLLEEVGAKEMRVGGAYVWEGHANVIVAGEGATPGDFLALAWLMRTRVQQRLGVNLIPEVQGILV